MAKELALAASHNETVYLTGHIPPDPSLYKPSCQHQYVSISTQYTFIIAGHLYGHTHDDNFILLGPKSSKSSSTPNYTVLVNIVPSLVATFNPSFRVWKYNPSDRNKIVDYDQFMGDLDKANAQQSLTFYKEYSFLTAYQSIVHDFSITSYTALQNTIATNSTVAAQFNNFRYLGQKKKPKHPRLNHIDNHQEFD